MVTAYLVFRSQEGFDTICVQPIAVRAPSPPRITLAGLNGSTIAAGELRMLRGVVLVPADEEFGGAPWRLLRYTVSLLRPGTEESASTITGAADWTTSAEISRMLQGALPGDRLLIGDAFVEGSGGAVVELAPVSVRVAE